MPGAKSDASISFMPQQVSPNDESSYRLFHWMQVSLVAIQDLERASSKARNPNLIEFLRTYKITDKSARGILTIYQATRNRGLLKPKFENISSCFRATLFFSSPHTNEDQTWLQRINNNYRLKDTQINALIHAKHNRAISNREYCNINHKFSWL